MKIGIIVTDLYQLGGVERVALLLGKIFTEFLQHEVTIFSCFTRPGKGSAFFECSDKIKIVHLSEKLDPESWLVKNSFSQKTLLKYRVLKELKKYLKDNPQNAVITTVCWCNCFISFFCKPAKAIGCDHGSFKAIPWIYRMLCRIFYRRLDVLLSLTGRNLQHYTFVNKRKQFVMPNPCSFSCDEQSSYQNKKIVCLARFSHEKGIDTLLYIAAKLKERIPDWTLDIYGSGEEKELLFDLSAKLNLQKFVNFHPATQQAKEKLCTSSIYVMSSRSEGLPMTLLEAQVCGLPIVSFDCDCGPSDIITDGVDGFLIPPGDLDGFADAVVKLANNEELRQKFGAAAKENSKRFSPEKISVLWKTMFDSL